MPTFAEKLRALGEMSAGAVENAAMIGSGMVAEPLAGLYGIGSGLSAKLRGKDFMQGATGGIEEAREKLTYQPRTDIGKRGAENIGQAVETVAAPLRENVLDPIGERSPLAAAVLLAGTEVVGGRAKPKVPKVRAKPVFEAGSPQQLLPGIEPRSPKEMLGVAQGAAERAWDKADITDPETNLQYSYSPVSDHYGIDQAEGATQVSRFNDVGARYPEDLLARARAGGDTRTAQALLDRVDEANLAAERVADVRRDMARQQMGENTQRIRELRAERGQGDAREQLAREREIYRLKSVKPIEHEGRVYAMDPMHTGTPYNRGGLVEVATREYPPDEGRLQELVDARDERLTQQRRRATELRRAAEDEQNLEDLISKFVNTREEPTQPGWVNRLTQSPTEASGRTAPADARTWRELLGLSRKELAPELMNRKAVKSFLSEIKDNPDAFMYGLRPGPGVRDLEDMARHFSKKSGKDVDVDYSFSDPDDIEQAVLRSVDTDDAIEITWPQGDDAHIEALRAKPHGDAALLYQIALSDAVRRGYNIGTDGLTGPNTYRLLSNSLSNAARWGENPRNLARETRSGDAPQAIGLAEAPEIWRAEWGETISRAKRNGGQPEDLMFDPQAGFLFQGNPISADQIKNHMEELAGSGWKQTRVGQKSLMRAAVWDWLRRANPEDAAAAAKKWKLGPLFTSVAGATTLGSMLRGEEEPMTQ